MCSGWIFDNATEVIIKGNGYQKHCHILIIMVRRSRQSGVA